MGKSNHTCLGNQGGAALAISLIILLVLTLLVVSSTQGIVLQERMTSAVRDSHLSLAVAEAGVKDAEIFIEGLSSIDDFKDDGAGGLFAQTTTGFDLFADIPWDTSGKYRTSSEIDGMTAKYVIFYKGEVTVAEETLTGINMLGYGQTTGGGNVRLFQIISRATGRSDTAERTVSSYYGKRF